MAMPQDEDKKLSPFARAEAEAAAEQAAALGKARAEGGVFRGVPATPAAGVPTGQAGSSQTATRAPFLATEAAQYLKLQEERLERARSEAAKRRFQMEAERLRSHAFIKKQELARVATRLRAAESALVAAEAEERRSRATGGKSDAALHEKMSARTHISAERDALERDFERRIAAEAKAGEALEREMNNHIKRGGFRHDYRYREFERRRHDRAKGLASIQRERIRRRAELASRDVTVAREIASAERSGTSSRRSGDLATSLVAKYRQQVRAFQVAEQTLRSDHERLERDLAKAEAEIRRVSSSGR
jgi:hypothetical protein